MGEHLKIYAKTHIFYIVIIAISVIAFRTWLSEHDARVKAEITVKEAETAIKTLQDHQAATDAAATQKVQVITKIVHDAATPTQVVAALPQVDTQIAAQLNARPLPEDPAAVAVNAAVLIQIVGDLKTSQIQLGACQSNLADEKNIVTEKDKEIAALKRKPGFWARIKSHGKWAIVGMFAAEGARIYLGRP